MRTKRTLLNMAYALRIQPAFCCCWGLSRGVCWSITSARRSPPHLRSSASFFNFFSIAEFGVGSVISYRLYEQIAAKNEEKISKYMSMYKWAYRVVGMVIAGLALLGAVTLRWIMPDVPPPRPTLCTG